MQWQPAQWELETERLRVVSWRRRGDDALAAFLVSALTRDVTRELPPSWQGVDSAGAAAWIAEREREGLMFLVETKQAGDLVGVFMFFPGDATPERGEVRLGYVLAKHAWGRGYATELVDGFVRHWDSRGVTAELLAGVTVDNVPSRRVLEKCGFEKAGEHDGVLTYRRGRGTPGQ